MTKYTLIGALKQVGIVVVQEVQLSHAGKSNVYFNVKKAYGNPFARQLIIDEFWKMIEKDVLEQNKNVTVIAGAGYGGITPASIIAAKHDIKLSLIRTEPKQHGLQKQIEAHEPTQDDLVAIVEDVTTSGQTLQKATDIIQATGATVIGCYTVVKRGEAKLSVPLKYMITAEQLLEKI